MLEGRHRIPYSAATRGGRSRLRRRLGTAVSTFRNQGPAGVLVAVAGRLPSRLIAIEWYELREVVAPGDPTADPWPETRRAGVRDVRDLAAVGHVRGEEARARLDAGDVAYLATDGGVPVGYVWFRAGAWREGDVEYVLADDERWGYDLFVAAGHRGRRIAPALMVSASQALWRDGVRRTLAVIDHLNEASRRAARHYDGRPVTTCTTVALGGLVALRERRAADDGGTSWCLARRRHGIVRVAPPHGTRAPGAGSPGPAPQAGSPPHPLAERPDGC